MDAECDGVAGIARGPGKEGGFRYFAGANAPGQIVRIAAQQRERRVDLASRLGDAQLSLRHVGALWAASGVVDICLESAARDDEHGRRDVEGKDWPQRQVIDVG